ncbi:MAG TPA: hypothetical protein VK471_02535 [Solirubrobacterales bacterium]|nr:hypothetical protein [Solirubrobacterales bacterium]
MSAAAQTSNEEHAAEVRHQAELDAQREEFHRELSRRAFRIGELEEEVHKVAQTYETSLSWRITKPVRSAKTVLAKLRRG